MLKYRGSTVRIKYKGLDTTIRISDDLTQEEKDFLIEQNLQHLLEEVGAKKKKKKEEVKEENKEVDNGEA